MGTCSSCFYICCGKQEDSSQFGDTGDRTQLIDPSSDNSAIQRIQNENFYRYDTVYAKKGEENSDLNNILQEMATNVIDVASLGSHSMEQFEYKERMNFYMSKMKNLTLSKPLKLPKHSLLVDVLNPDKLFIFSCPINSDELHSIFTVLNEIDSMLDDIKIENPQDLMIPFQIQT